jgi:heat shock protein HslJ
MKKPVLYLLIGLTLISACTQKLSPDSYWGSQRWILIEMKEVPVQQSGTRRDAFLEFIPAEKKITGNAGCNRINGGYILEKKNHINFQDVISTKMACQDMAFETTFLSLLNEVNRYEQQNSTLILKNDRKILFKFEQRNSGR